MDDKESNGTPCLAMGFTMTGFASSAEGREVVGGGIGVGGESFSFVERNCVQCKTAAGICNI